MKKNIFILPLLAALLSACGSTPQNNPSEPTPGPIDQTPGESETVLATGISLNLDSVSLLIGETTTLVATVTPSNTTNKTVLWSSDDTSVATVNNGVITAVSGGYTTIRASIDGKTASCEIEVTENSGPTVGEDEELKVSTLSATNFTKGHNASEKTFDVDYITFSFTQESGTYVPGWFDGANGSFKIYEGNKLTLTSKKGNIKEINITYNANKNSSSAVLSSDVGTLNTDYTKWTGDASSVTFQTTGGTKAFSTFEIKYAMKSHHAPIDLGKKTIREVKDYIVANAGTDDFEVNPYGMGADAYTSVTIQGVAMAKLHTVKTASQYGYNITEPNKVVLGDETDHIAVATKVGNGTFYEKVNNHQMKATSKYTVTGYISMSLGQPELICTSFTWDQNLETNYNLSAISKGNISISDFYTKAENINYNVSGYGYEEAYTLKGLTCYYEETAGSGKAWYNLTDGTNNIRVNAYNVGRMTIGNVYDVTGIISIEKYSPIIIAYEFKNSTASKVDLDTFFKSASTLSIHNLKAINYVNETENKYPNVINAYKGIYKTTGYITTIEEGYKFYIGISDSYINTKDFPNGKAGASAKYDLALFKYDQFWNIDDPYYWYKNYLEVTYFNEPVTVYYTPRQTGFSNDKMYWEILLIPQSIPEIVVE